MWKYGCRDCDYTATANGCQFCKSPIQKKLLLSKKEIREACYRRNKKRWDTDKKNPIPKHFRRLNGWSVTYYYIMKKYKHTVKETSIKLNQEKL
jgi:hypothetical protein